MKSVAIAMSPGGGHGIVLPPRREHSVSGAAAACRNPAARYMAGLQGKASIAGLAWSACHFAISSADQRR